MPRKLTKEKLDAMMRSHITIDFSTYKNSNTKCKFIDSEYGEWWAIMANVEKWDNLNGLKKTPETEGT